MKNKKRILVVDDDSIFTAILRRILMEEGYKVFCLNNGKVAVKYVKNKKFNLVFLDMQMPGIDGIETLRRIRKIDKSIPIILMSAYLSDKNVEKAIKLGISDCIIKSCRYDEIKCKAKRALIKKIKLSQNKRDV